MLSPVDELDARTGDEIHQALIAQIASPVRWVECARSLAAAGCEAYLELGPGRVLGGLTKQTLGMETDATSADSPKRLDAFLEAHAAPVD